ncbi:DUF1707 domain-containing protein [Streptomyces sp. NPDC006967]|nr:DUF1707 domain-containing protein [Streptomyces sp. SM1]
MTAQPPEPSPLPASPGGLRASHDDREAVVEQLRDASTSRNWTPAWSRR